mgnify:CR=1 FL=1
MFFLALPVLEPGRPSSTSPCTRSAHDNRPRSVLVMGWNPRSARAQSWHPGRQARGRPRARAAFRDALARLPALQVR